MNTPVSVIVAVYNAEKTLPRLLDSLLMQTMKDFEVLMIDDGSTDGSGSICDGYALKDNRFKAYHKPNEGIGATRQFGIEHASGDYTIHADADDWVEPDFLELLYDKAVSTGADMVLCDYLVEEHNRTTLRKQEPKAFDKKGFTGELIGRLGNSSWNKLLRRSVYVEHGIAYMPDLSFGEDLIFNLQYVMTGITIAYVPKALYHYDYFSNTDSAVHGVSLKKIQNRELFISRLRSLLQDEYRTGIDNKHLEIAYLAIMSRAYSKAEFKERFSFLSRVRWKEYSNNIFSIKVIIWTSLNVSYNLALMLSRIKKTVRRIRQKNSN